MINQDQIKEFIKEYDFLLHAAVGVSQEKYEEMLQLMYDEMTIKKFTFEQECQVEQAVGL